MITEGLDAQQITTEYPQLTLADVRAALEFRSCGGGRTATPVAYASLRFLVDECLSPRLCALLIDAGHDAVLAGDRGLLGAPDDAVIRAAFAESRTVVSADTDFGDLLPASAAPYLSVVLFRRQSRIAETQARVLLTTFSMSNPTSMQVLSSYWHRINFAFGASPSTTGEDDRSRYAAARITALTLMGRVKRSDHARKGQACAHHA